MKRTVAILLCVLLLLSLAACGGKPASSEKTEKSETSAGETHEKKTEEKESPKKEDSQKEKPEKEKSEDKLSWKDIASMFGKDGKSDDSGEPSPETDAGTEPEAAPEPVDAVSETVRLMAGSYVIRSYDNYDDKYYDYVKLENQRIANGRPSGELTLNEDGTGRLRCLDKEADVRWDEDSFLMDGAECQFRFIDQSLYLDTPDGEHVLYSKLSHLDAWNQSNLHSENREVADAADYAVGEPELTRYHEGKRSYILFRVPIENKSDQTLVLDELFFTTFAPDGRELGFFSLPANGIQVLLPGESGEFIFQYFVTDKDDIGFGTVNDATFPENAVVRIDEVDVFRWKGPYQRYDAEITEIVAFVDTYTGTYMVYRPNGYVTLPEGTDIQDLYIHIYCYDKDGKIIGLGGQFATEESVNPVNYFEEIPGEHRAKFQTNMNGPYQELSYPTERIGRYVVVVDSPEYFY